MSIIDTILIKKFINEKFDNLYSILRAGELITTWAGVQHVVRAGLAHKFFEIGDQFVAEFDGEPVVWNIIGIDHDVPSDPNFVHSLTIQTNDCLMNAQFSAPQALWHAGEELPAGTHRFTLNGIQYTFATSKPVPAGGHVYIGSWGEATYEPATITTYEDDRRTSIETNLAVLVSSSGSDTLTPVNHHQRCRYGSNNYLESVIRQWLNSKDAAFEWQPQTPYDRPSSYGGGGFLHRLDPELAAVIGPVEKQVARNTVTDGGGQDVFRDKVFLLSRVEVYAGGEGTTIGEEVYPFYKAMASSATTDGIEERIKYLGASARNWWLRSPYTGSAHYVRTVTTSGSITINSARSSYGAAPACCIW